MGQKITQSKNTVIPEADTFLLKYVPELQFKKILNDGTFMKTVLCVDESEGQPLVCKIYFKRDNKETTDQEKNLYYKHLNTIRELKDLFVLSLCPNVSPTIMTKDLPKAGLIIRQYYYFNLKDRMTSMPYLTNIEKKWISFQLVYSLYQIHSKGCCHGDIKIENVMLSSSGSVFLADISPYKPAYIQEDDVGSINDYFGTNSANKSCYLAPERLVEKTELEKLTNNLYNFDPKMDIFSLGCVIAELFLENVLFDHPNLLAYKKGNFDLSSVLSRIQDKNLEEVLMVMLATDPSKRVGTRECLNMFEKQICPVSFSGLFIHINTLLIRSEYWKPDRRIGLIYKHWKQIWKVIYGPCSTVPELYNNLNHHIQNKLILFNAFSSPLTFQLIINNHNDDDLVCEYDENIFSENENSDSILIVVNLILSSILYCKYSTTKILGLEMLRIFSNKLPDIMKIQIIIPYMITLLRDNSILVRYTVLNEIINILTIIEDIILPSSDYDFFGSYIFPAIFELYNSGEPSLILAFVNVLDKLTDLEQKFLEITLRSKFHNSKTSNQYMLEHSLQSFNNQHSNVQKGEEIIQAYEIDLHEFKQNLFKIMEDILYRNENDLDIQQTLIKKLPNLMLFFGRREKNNFSKFIISYFNKNEWIIQREIIKCIPSFIMTLGETAFDQIYPCLEGIIYNNLNELKIYEMIHTIHLLLKMEYLENSKAIDLFKKVFPYVIHPNLWIQTEVLDFAKTLLSTLSQAEIYTYLRSDLLKYMKMPFILITNEFLVKAVKESISRVIYELETRNYKYMFKRNEEDEEAFILIKKIIDDARSKFLMRMETTKDEADLIRFKAANEPTTITTHIKKEFLNFLKFYQNQDDVNDIPLIERTFLGRLISVSSMLPTMNFPSCYNRRASATFISRHDHILGQDNFKTKYLLKSLDIIVFQDMLDYVDDLLIHSGSSIQVKDMNSEKVYSKQAMNLLTWRPSGKLLSTLYDHNASVEKIIPMNMETNNMFLSFSSDGQMYLWEITTQDNDFNTEKLLEHKIPEIDFKAISPLDSHQFAVANKNKKIEIYKVESNKSDFFVMNTYNINSEDGDITTLLGSNKNKDNKTLVYCSQRGKLVIYDLRIRTPAMSYNIGLQRGLINAVDYSKDERGLYLGTLGGYLLNYDFRLNYLVGSWKYNENTPIIGLSSYTPTKAMQYDYSNLNSNNNYLLIWAGGQDHEIGLWNLNTFNCDMLLKVNQTQGKQSKPFLMEIPYIYKDNTFEENDREYLDLLTKTITQYKSKAFYIETINSEFYSLSNKRFSKITNLYESSSTVQVALSPLITRFSENNSENASYIMTAGNDMTIRYWDLSKENMLKKSYVINAPSTLNYVSYNTCCYCDTVILQSNEVFSSGPVTTTKKDSNFSEYQLYNGICFQNNLTSSNYDDDEGLSFLKYVTKISEASHKNVITDLQTIYTANTNLLISSSWDGTIKIWK